MIAQLPQATDASFDELVFGAPSPVLVEFYAPWCGHCRRMAPIVEGLARDYEGRLQVVQVNADQNRELLQRYGVRGVPTFVLFVDDKEVDRTVGEAPRETLAAHIERALVHAPRP